MLPPLLLFWVPLVTLHVHMGKPGTSKQNGPWKVGAKLVGGIRGRWSKAKLAEAGSSSPLSLAGSEGFRLLGLEFQLFQQPVILFKQPLLFK